ncbi:MAG: hypothetical protein OEY14_14085, partial [Myxococcales bacterium]|nr:hypothetical protein [Myxococcales bacterium]
MKRRAPIVCQAVLLLALALSSLACSSSHGRPLAGADAGPIGSDAGFPDRALPPDAAPDADAPPSPGCRFATIPTRITRACLGGGSARPPALPSGSTLLANLDGGCFCGEALFCSAALGPDGVLELRTELCPAPD